MTNIRIYVTSIDSVATQKSTNRELFRSFLSTSREQWKSHVLGTHFQLFPTINREAFSFLFRFNLFSSFFGEEIFFVQSQRLFLGFPSFDANPSRHERKYFFSCVTSSPEKAKGEFDIMPKIISFYVSNTKLAAFDSCVQVVTRSGQS